MNAQKKKKRTFDRVYKASLWVFTAFVLLDTFLIPHDYSTVSTNTGSSAAVVSSRAELTSLPASCTNRLVLDGVDYGRGGSVELWRVGAGWKAVWAADVRGRRPWTRQADPDFSDSGG